jgi:hypothetical protein
MTAPHPPTLDYRRIKPANRRRRISWRGIAVVGWIIAIALLFQLALYVAVRR